MKHVATLSLAVLLVSTAFALDQAASKPKVDAGLRRIAETVNEAFGPRDAARSIELIETHFAPAMELFLTVPHTQAAIPREQLVGMAREAMTHGGTASMSTRESDWFVGVRLAVRKAREVFEIGGQRIPVFTTSVFEKIDSEWALVHAHHSYVDDHGAPRAEK